GAPRARLAAARRTLAPRSSGPLKVRAGLLDARSRGAAFEVIVDQPHGLHERVDGRRSDEAKAATREILGQRGRLGRAAELHERGLGHALGSAAWLGLEAPHVGGERAKLVGERDSLLGVVQRGLDLAAVADDAGIVEQLGGARGGAPARDLLKVE